MKYCDGILNISKNMLKKLNIDNKVINNYKI